MKFFLTLLFVSAIRLAAGQDEDLLTPFEWTAGSICGDVYDFSGTLEFCERPGGGYGYKQPGQECLTPGPLIRIRSNTKYLLTLKNTVPGLPTNLHTHGPHISGDGNQDDITRVIDTTNKCLHYNWDVPNTQSSGTNWYHAHVHHHTLEQVGGGALGMLVVEDVLNGDLNGVAPVVPQSCTNRDDIEAFLENEKQIVAAKIDNTWTGNGVVGGTILVRDFDWTRFRIAVSDPGGGTGLVEIVAPSKNDPPPCESWVIAYDGVYTSQVPLKDITDTGNVITGSSRIDLAVRCSSQAYLKYDGKLIAEIIVSEEGPTPATSTPFCDGAPWTPTPPHHPNSLHDASVDPVDGVFDIKMTAAQINGVVWDPIQPLLSRTFDSVQEWTLSSTNAHPYHQHLYHMQPQHACDHHEAFEWYDTIAATGDCVVRFKMADIGGRCVFHCHVLSHEDNGSMAWMDVTGGPGPVLSDPTVDELECHVCNADSTPGPAPTPPPTPQPPTCNASGASCTANGDCCSGNCKGNGTCK